MKEYQKYNSAWKENFRSVYDNINLNCTKIIYIYIHWLATIIHELWILSSLAQWNLKKNIGIIGDGMGINKNNG